MLRKLSLCGGGREKYILSKRSVFFKMKHQQSLSQGRVGGVFFEEKRVFSQTTTPGGPGKNKINRKSL